MVVIPVAVSPSSCPRRRYPMAFGLCAGTIRSLDAPIGQLRGSWGWWTDGSLRAHGKVFIPTEVRILQTLRHDKRKLTSSAVLTTLYGLGVTRWRRSSLFDDFFVV